MAPSRRKGASKAAAAAAARRQWKVGDLVLAKVKGFPAWPATVSEPEKWGYSSDWKKVLVYFFGTKQIAFCNPADVEEFNEEKKESLMGKRQGRSSDFVRAVQEIIDCYEKLKESNLADQLSSGDGPAENAADGDLVGSKTTLHEDSQDSGLKVLSPKPKNENSVEVGALMEVESLHQRDASEEPVDNAVASQPHTYTLRKKSRRSQPKRYTSQRNISVQRSRSLLRSDSRGSQNGDSHCRDGKISGEGGINGFWDGPLRRAKRSKRSPDGCAPTAAGGSPICNSNGTVEDNGSDVAMIESETLSNNEGSADEYNRKHEHYELLKRSCEGLELSRRLDLQAKSAIVRKKRNPGRRRILNDASESASRLDQEAKMEVELQKDSSVPVTSCENAIDSHPKNEGDEHLPLVKRARVRMGKLISEEKQQLDSLAEIEERPVEPHPTSVSSDPDAPVNCDNTSRSGPLTLNNSGSSLFEDKYTNVLDNKQSEKAYTCVVNEPMVCLESENCAWVPENKPQPWEVAESQAFVCAVDGEAALPPSKRLHQALEAMSADSAEVKQTFIESPLCKKTDEEHIPSARTCSNMLVEDKVVKDIRLPVKSLQCSDISNVDCDNVAHSSAPMACDIIIKSSGDVPMSDLTNKLPDSSRVGSPKDRADEVAVSRQDKDVCGLCPINASDNALQGQAFQALSTSISRSETVVESVEIVRAPLSTEDVSKAGTEECKCLQENNEVSAVHSDGCRNLVPQEGDASADGHHDGVSVDPYNRETNGLSAELVKTTADESTQATTMRQPVEDQHAAEDVNIESSISLSLKVSSMQQTCHDPASGCPSHDQDDTTITTRTSSAGVDVNKVVSQPNDGMNATNKNNHLQHIEYCSTDAMLPQKKRISSDECTSSDPMNLQAKSGERINLVEVKAALASLELTLGSLTRTKESIGRATRIAVDCVKFGVATEVVELLSLYLEKESSMHRRVDLFFLVDSIAQCCRSLKGDVGGTYISAVKETLGRMLSAAAPSGQASRENRRQCLKVLRLWLERRILPDTAVRQHIRELESQNSISSTGGYSRRMSRTERSFDDPLRDMEGMFVDEYGSNSSFQLPGFCMPRMLKEEEDGSDSDGGSFEAVTPEHDAGNKESREVTELPSIEKHRHILEDVDGELEMEDVAPCDVDIGPAATSTGNAVMNTHCSIPPLPHDVPRAPPLPTSPPPLPPPPPPPPPPSLPPPPPLVSHSPAISHVSVDSQLHAGRNSGQEAVLAHPPASGYHLPMQMTDATPSCSYNSYPVMHPPAPSGNNLQQADANFYGKPYPRPPYPSPSNQFSYFPVDHQIRPPREAPPSSYYDRPHYSQNLEGGHAYSDQDNIRAPRHELANGWGYSRLPYPPSQGPVHSENDQAYPMYPGPSCEPGRPHEHGWAYPHPVHHPNHIPGRPPCDGPVPAGVRGPGYWRPR